MKILIGIIYILHGLVHLLYMGHSLKQFELEKGFIWPQNSCLLAGILSPQKKEMIAAALCAIAALCFILAGIFALTDQSLQKIVTIAATLTSTILYVSFWNGRIQKWHTQGGIAIIINMAILAYTFI